MNIDLSIDEIVSELLSDELGRVKWQAAQLAAANKRLVARIQELEATQEDAMRAVAEEAIADHDQALARAARSAA